jgi:hypothetical protein
VAVRGTKFGSGIGRDRVVGIARDDSWTDPTINWGTFVRGLTNAEVGYWIQFVIDHDLYDDLIFLQDGIEQEVRDGWFRIEGPGDSYLGKRNSTGNDQHEFVNQNDQYKALWQMYVLFRELLTEGGYIRITEGEATRITEDGKIRVTNTQWDFFTVGD